MKITTEQGFGGLVGSPICSRIFRMIFGSSMAALIFILPPHLVLVSTSILKERSRTHELHREGPYNAGELFSERENFAKTRKSFAREEKALKSLYKL